MTYTPTSCSSTNRVIVIGMLDTIRDRGKEVLHRTQRNARRGKMEYLAIQVRSPYGGSFLLPLVVESGIKGNELLQSAKAGAPLALEGEIQLFKRFGRRFADDAEDEGRQVREMFLNVLAIRLPSEEEQYATSAVWLTGEVVEPPRFMRHPDLPDVQLAITVLEVTLERPSPMPGSRAITSMPARVRVAIPTSYEHAGALYRAGNQVLIEGQVDCIIEAQGGAAIEAQIAKLRIEREAQQAELASKSEQEQRNAERAYRRARASFLEAPRVQVLAGYVELLGGEKATIDEARVMRREHIQRMRDRRAAGQQQRTQARGNGRGPTIAEAGPDVIAASLEQPRDTVATTTETVGLVQPVRARQRRDRAAGIDSNSAHTTLAKIATIVNVGQAAEAALAEDVAVDAVSIIPVDQVLLPLVSSDMTTEDHEKV